MNDVHISIAVESDAEAWDSFVEEHKLHPSFLWGWRNVFKDTFAQNAKYLIAKDSNGIIVGILPLINVRSFLFGNSLVSVPYLNAGSVFANSSEVGSRLIDEAIALTKSENLKYLELRSRHFNDYNSVKSGTLHKRSHKVAMVLPLKGSSDDLFASFPSKLRSQIRRPTKAGLTSSIHSGGDVNYSLIESFYQVFSRNMRDLGTPVYPKKLFLSAAKAFGDRLYLIIVSKGDTPAAAGILIRSGNYIEILWASSVRSLNKLSPNMLLYWEALKLSCELGCEYFDFGRSTQDSGQHRFKKQWGSEEVPLGWYYFMNRGEMPDVNPKAGGFSLLSSVWQKLPLPVANLLGPFLTKNIP